MGGNLYFFFFFLPSDAGGSGRSVAAVGEGGKGRLEARSAPPRFHQPLHGGGAAAASGLGRFWGSCGGRGAEGGTSPWVCASPPAGGDAAALPRRPAGKDRALNNAPLLGSSANRINPCKQLL